MSAGSACDRLAMPPERCVYIGDNYWDDVLGAREAGMEAVQDPVIVG